MSIENKQIILPACDGYPELKINYLESGSENQELFLCVHGWPTRAFLYRKIMKELPNFRMIAPDLPGFGDSDKPNVKYSFDFYEHFFKLFTQELGLKKFNLIVHDLGGPLALFWALKNQGHLKRLIFFNTVIYSKFSLAVKAFIGATYLPLLKDLTVSQWGLKMAMKTGVVNQSNLTPEVIEMYQAPFRTPEAKKHLLESIQLDPYQMAEIENRLPSVKVPTAFINGKKDLILPEIANTVKRVRRDLPKIKTWQIDDAGHFLQEDQPELIARIITQFIEESLEG